MLISDYEELGKVVAYMQSKNEEITRRRNEMRKEESRMVKYIVIMSSSYRRTP